MRGIGGDAVDPFEPALQGIDIIGTLHLPLPGEGAGQGTVVVVLVMGFVFLQGRDVHQRLPVGGIDIGEPVFGIVFIPVVELVFLSRLEGHPVHFTADQVVVVADELEAVVAVGGKQPLAVVVKQVAHIAVDVIIEG